MTQRNVSARTASRSALARLAAETHRLERGLAALIRRYPEDGMEPDNRIFHRLLTNDWRYSVKQHGPLEQRYAAAAQWVAEFDAYVRSLLEYCMLAQKEVQLPLTGRLRIPVAEILRLLRLQRQILVQWQEDPAPHGRDNSAVLRDKLQRALQTRGAKAVAAEAGVNRDTLQDFVQGKTAPRQKTLLKLHDYLSQ